MFHETFDRATLAGGVAALEQDNNLLAGLFYPFLDLE
jgi:hypothetical protein